jgi:hypothetical protein
MVKKKKFCPLKKTRSHWTEENMGNEKERSEIKPSCVKLD